MIHPSKNRLLKKIGDNLDGCWGFFEILPGWYEIVIQLHEEISKIDPKYKIDQIKQKYGGLRYYVTLSDDLDEEDREKIYTLIEEAEGQALNTCEHCGSSPAMMHKERGWYLTTVCEEHKS